MRAILAACALLCVLTVPAGASWLSPLTLFGPAVKERTLPGYQRASASRSCLTAATRSVLARLEARFGTVKVISTCRPGAVIAGTRRPSYHRYGMAVDFMAPRGRKAEVVQWLYRQGTLVMTYGRMSHVHFNLGQGARIACGGCGKKIGRKARKAYAAVRP